MADISENIYPVFDSYIEALKTGSKEDVESYIYVLRETLSGKELGNYDIMGADSLIRDLIIRSLISEYSNDFDRMNETLDVFESAATRINLALSKRLSQEYQAEGYEHRETGILHSGIPMLQLDEGLLVVPLAGSLDIHQLEQITSPMLESINRHRIKVILMDMSNVTSLEDDARKPLGEMLTAAQIMGSKIIITGISVHLARKLISLKIKWSEISTIRELQKGINEAKKLMRQLNRSKALEVS